MQADDRAKNSHAPSQRENLLLEPYLAHVKDIRRHYGPVLATQPPQGGRARHSEVSDDVGIARDPHQAPQSMVVGPLRSSDVEVHGPIAAGTTAIRQPSRPAGHRGRTAPAKSLNLSGTRTRKSRMSLESAAPFLALPDQVTGSRRRRDRTPRPGAASTPANSTCRDRAPTGRKH